MHDKSEHDKVQAFLESLGYVDFYYGGINMAGESFHGYRVGAPRAEVSNIHRQERLVGLMECSKTSMALPRWLENPDNEMEDET
jgi:hypothetical protein